MLFDILLEAIEVASDPTLLVDLESLFLPAGLKPDLTRKVEGPGRDETAVDQAIDRAFTHHDGVPIGDIDMMRGLPLTDQGRDQLVQCRELIFGKRDSGAGFGKGSMIILISV